MLLNVFGKKSNQKDLLLLEVFSPIVAL